MSHYKWVICLQVMRAADGYLVCRLLNRSDQALNKSDVWGYGSPCGGVHQMTTHGGQTQRLCRLPTVAAEAILISNFRTEKLFGDFWRNSCMSFQTLVVMIEHGTSLMIEPGVMMRISWHSSATISRLSVTATDEPFKNTDWMPLPRCSSSSFLCALRCRDQDCCWKVPSENGLDSSQGSSGGGYFYWPLA